MSGGFGLKSVPASFASDVKGQTMPVKSTGVRNWLDDIMFPTEIIEGQFQRLRQTFDCLRKGRLSVNLPKSEFCNAVLERLGMTIDSSGVRPAPSKLQATSQLSQPTTVDDVRVLLGMGRYVISFIPSFSTVVAPISDLLRDKRFQEKKALKSKHSVGGSSGRSCSQTDRTSR